jgi:D-glycero-beta-D-manno-heptose 1-phosphate adenylyltransferase
VDTRTKILSPAAATEAAAACRSAGKRICAVSGYHDPLTAGHARLLAAAGEPGGALFIIVADPPRPVLPARARAELVAGLAIVDYVVLPGGEGADSVLETLNADVVYREEAADQRRTADLIRHVQSRQS